MKTKLFMATLFAVAACQGPGSDGGPETVSAGPQEHGGEPGTRLSSPLDECGPPDGVPEVVITEVFANGAAPAQGWVELHRPFGTEVTLDGWTLAGLPLPAGGVAVTIPAYGYVVVCGANAAVACDLPLAGLELGGSGTMSLEDPQDVMDQVAWSEAPGAGRSWQLRHPWLDNAQPGPAWVEEARTPGERNATAWQDVEAAECADALPCTLDLCDQGACAHPARPDCCSGSAQCNDNDPCTYDYCEANACTHASKGDTCCDSDLDCVAKFFESECFVDRCVAGTCSHWFDASNCCKDDAFCEAAHEDGNDCTTERCVVIDPGTGRRECRNVIEPDCRTTCPYSEGFDAASSMALAGWAITDLGTPAASNWRFETGGDLGPDRFLKFGWDPTTPTVRSVAHGPKIDCHKADLSLPDGDWSNVLKTSTLQFRMRYRHSQGGGPVSIRAVVTEDGGQTWTPVAEWNDLTADLEYGIHSYPLPGTSWKGPALQVGFMVDTGSGSTFDMDSLLVDDVKVVPGVPNRFEKAVLLRCLPGASDCSNATRYATVCDTQPLPGSSVPACVVAAGEALPEMSVGVCEWYKVLACFRDPDATYSTWNFFGFPAGWIEGAPLDPAPFVSSEGCFSDVGDFCPATPNSFLCVFQVRPDCDESHAGTYRSGLVTVDEHDPAKAPHSIFESLTKFTVNVLLESGWVIWSPLGAADPSAVALKAAVAATGRKVQIVKGLAGIPELGKYDGVIATLGVRGRYHVVTDAEAARLASYLAAGGRVWLEGGDFFTAARQPATALHPYLAAWGTGEASGKIAPPVTGRAFLEGLSVGVSAGPLNASNGLLARAPGSRAREVLRLEGASPVSALAVSHEGAVAGGGTWRTVGSSFPWSALVGGETPSMILAATLGFLEDGYGEVGCTDATPCDDQDPCTVDACTGGACTNALLPGCTECLDDAVMIDGVTPSCGAAEACVVADGRCTPIACGGAPCTIVAAAEGAQTNRVFTQASPARSEIAVSHAGNLVDLQVKVRLSNLSYRGPVRLTLQAPDGRTVVLKDYDAGVESDLYATYDVGVPPVGSLDALATGAGGAPVPVAGTWALLATVDPAGFPVTGRIAGWQIHASWACDPRFTGEDCAACAPGWTGAGCATSKVFFSEYVEGSGNNKAVEIHNASDAPVDLSGCAVRTYYNGASTPASVIALFSTLPPGGSVTICHHLDVAPACDQASSEPSYLSFNGDDAVELWCGTTRDAIGQIGTDPGTYWASGAVQTQDRTLRRACGITAGDTNGTDAFDPAAEWEVFPIDTLDGLDWRGCGCALSPCVHGTCTNAGESYTCACDPGWEGRDCDVNTDDCTPNPCVHGACTDLVAGYSCACDAGWYGDTCASDTDWCTPNPCVHGQCTIGVTGPDCACDAGWTGATCAVNIDDCTPNPCVHGTCTDGVASHTCACDEGFAGADCDRSALFFSEYVEGTGNNKAVEVANAGLVPLDRGACSVRVYSNGSPTPTATVPLTAGSIPSGGIWVLCNPALVGAATWCDQTSGSLTHNGDDAIDLFCGGAVRDVFGKVGEDPGTAWGGLTADHTLRRKCAIGGGDARGDDAFDPTVEWDVFDADTLGGLKTRGCKCLTNPCAHGTCVDLGTSERCACSAGWTGDNCDVETNECDPNPCLNGGTCTDGVGSFTCDCPDGWAGATCNVILGTTDAWCQVVAPGTIALEIGAFGTAWSSLYVPGLTDRDDGVNTVAGLRAEAGVGPDGTNPWGAGWAWVTATGRNGSSNNDSYSADLGGIPVPGSFDFAFRYSLDVGATWKYCDRDGSTPSGGDPQSGYATAQAGTLAVGCPAGQYDSGGSCLPCSAHCTACTGAAACSSCETGFFLHGTSCDASCPVGHWENPATRTCDACAAECAACDTAADDCTACKAGYVLSGASCVPDNPTCSGRTTLTAGTALSTGNGPSVVALADVNRDGKADAVVANRLSNTVSVLLGNGDGTFQPKTDYAVTAPAAMVVADVDADGNLDVAAASASTPSGVATVFWGNGDGTFVTPGATATTTGYPYGFAAGALNADARLDLAAGGTSTNQISVILHSGATARTFGAKVDTAINQPMSLAIGRLDGTNADIVSTSRSSNSVRVLRNNGSGVFTLFATSYATGSQPDALVLADVTGDGILDALTTNRGASTLSVLPGNGARGFGTRTDFATGSTGALPVTYSRTFALVDVNADGRPDAVVPDQSNAKVSVLLATGSTPIFGTRWTVDVGSGPISTAGGDVNNDGRPDVLVANYLGNSVSVLIAGCEATPACPDDGNPCTVEAWQPLNNACGWTNDETYAEACYTGAAGTKDVGNCRGGTKTCTSGVLGACTGQVLPASETCDGEDDDCNGQTDDGSLCSDGIACTADVCAGLAGCTYPVIAGKCLISGICRDAGDREPGQTCSGCVSGATAWGPLTGVACDDGQSCTTGDQCMAGACVGSAAANGTPCDDGDGCTTGESCTSGQCGGGTGTACASPDACHQAGACAFDRCAFPAAADGTACGGSTCASGRCGCLWGLANWPVAAFSKYPHVVALADLNADGVTDVIAADEWSSLSTGIVRWALSKADGGYAAEVAGDTGNASNHTFAIAVGDFKGDGTRDDFAVSLTRSGVPGATGWGGVAVFLNDGTGTLAMSPVYDLGTSAATWSVAAASFDSARGACEDIVASNSGTSDVVVLRNRCNGSGLFDVGGTLGPGEAGAKLMHVAAGDLDRDGDNDIVVASRGRGGVYVFANTGSGTFTAPTFYSNGTATDAGPSVVAIGDLDAATARPEILAVSKSTAAGKGVTVLDWNGTGYAVKNGPATFSTAYDQQSAVIGDFGGDGKLDVLVGNGTPTIWTGNGDGTFNATGNALTGFFSADWLAAADTNRDGRIDLIAAAENSNTFFVRLFHWAGSGTLLPAPLTTGLSSTGLHQLVAGDFNGDSIPDLATLSTSNSKILTHTGTGPGTFNTAYASSSPTSFNPVQIAVGRLNADARDDLVVNSYNGSAGTIYVYLAASSGAVPFGASLPTGGQAIATGSYTPKGVAIGDLDKDGVNDIVTVNASATFNVHVLKGSGTGTFTQTNALVAGPGSYMEWAALADVDRDGNLDLIATSSSQGKVYVMKGNGTVATPFQDATSYTVLSAKGASVGDVDGDGNPDIVAAKGSYNHVVLLLGNGTTSGFVVKPDVLVSNRGTTGAAANPWATHPADVDGDGKKEVLVTNAGSTNGTSTSGQNTVSILRWNAASANLALSGEYPAAQGPTGLVAFDTDADARADTVVVQNSVDKTLSVLRKRCR